jgi:hypothetical protein
MNKKSNTYKKIAAATATAVFLYFKKENNRIRSMFNIHILEKYKSIIYLQKDKKHADWRQ